MLWMHPLIDVLCFLGTESGVWSCNLWWGSQIKEQQHQNVLCPQQPQLQSQSHTYRYTWMLRYRDADLWLNLSRSLWLTATISCFEGTPVQNDLQEFYAIIEFVNPGILGSSTAYRKVYEEPILRSRQPSCTEVMLSLLLSLVSLYILYLHNRIDPYIRQPWL